VKRHTAPRFHGGTKRRFVVLIAGLFVFAIGIVCLYEARLGLSPWDVLNQGIAKHSPLSFGEANICVGVTVLALAATLGARIGLGTVANAVLVGAFVDQLLRIGWVTDRAHDSATVHVGLVIAGTALMGLATAIYIGATFGAGPRDSLMLVLSLRTHARIGIVRGLLEATALVAGFVLGGKVGVATLVYVAAIGPAVEASFALAEHSPFTL
jgi:uncharacterized membrane protein YczE